jgi:hypothetical protein
MRTSRDKGNSSSRPYSIKEETEMVWLLVFAKYKDNKSKQGLAKEV